MTAQVPETLIFEGEKLMMFSTPFDYFQKINNITFQLYNFNTACWRGYEGVWQVIDKRLYLLEINVSISYENRNGIEQDSIYKNEKKDPNFYYEPSCINILERIFPGYPDGVFAHWFTDSVQCPRGELLNYYHGGFLSQYEEDFILDFVDGILVNSYIIKNERVPLDE